MSRSQVSTLPTFSEQIGQKLSYHHDEVVITVEPFMLEKNGVLANGVLSEILTHMTQDLVVNSGRNLIIEQNVDFTFYRLFRLMMFYVFKLELFIIRDDRLLLIMTFISIIKLYQKQMLL